MTSNRIQRHPIQRRGMIVRVFTGFLLVFAAIVLLSSSPANAQLSGKGEIKGVVTDSTGAVVPDATVTATSTTQGTKFTRNTSNSGDFDLTALNPDIYSVTVTRQGFQTVTQQNVHVNALEIAFLMPGVQSNNTNGNATTNAGIVNGSGSRGAVTAITSTAFHLCAPAATAIRVMYGLPSPLTQSINSRSRPTATPRSTKARAFRTTTSNRAARSTTDLSTSSSATPRSIPGASSAPSTTIPLPASPPNRSSTATSTVSSSADRSFPLVPGERSSSSSEITM